MIESKYGSNQWYTEELKVFIERRENPYHIISRFTKKNLKKIVYKIIKTFKELVHSDDEFHKKQI